MDFVDVGSFVRQMLPFIIGWVAIPLGLLLFYALYLRPMLRKRRAAAQLKAVPVSAAAPQPAESSALDLLRQAAPSEPGNAAPRRKVETGDLPDLDALLAKPITPAAPAPRAAPDAPQNVKLHTGADTRAKPMLTILRDERDGRLMVQIGSTAYRTLLDTPDAKKAFTTLMKELSASILTPDTAPEPVEAPLAELSRDPTPAAPPEEEPIANLGELARRPPPATAEPPAAKKSAPPPRLSDGSIPGALPSYRFDDNPANIQLNRTGMVKRVEFVPPPDADIPRAIEAYLQYKISYNPEYQGRSIHVLPAIGGGVRIRVGEQYFDAVDDITDAEVKQFMKETIAEWQDLQ